jgi:hypothetical protein
MSAVNIEHPAMSDLTEYCDGMASVELTDEIEDLLTEHHSARLTVS